MATTAEQITAIETALASGRTSVTIDGQTVQWSLEQMRKQLNYLLGKQANAAASSSSINIPGVRLFGIVSSNGRGE